MKYVNSCHPNVKAVGSNYCPTSKTSYVDLRPIWGHFQEAVHHKTQCEGRLATAASLRLL